MKQCKGLKDWRSRCKQQETVVTLKNWSMKSRLKLTVFNQSTINLSLRTSRLLRLWTSNLLWFLICPPTSPSFNRLIKTFWKIYKTRNQHWRRIWPYSNPKRIKSGTSRMSPHNWQVLLRRMKMFTTPSRWRMARSKSRLKLLNLSWIKQWMKR